MNPRDYYVSDSAADWQETTYINSFSKRLIKTKHAHTRSKWDFNDILHYIEYASSGVGLHEGAEYSQDKVLQEVHAEFSHH